jgi:hypothetical protein
MARKRCTKIGYTTPTDPGDRSYRYEAIFETKIW